MFVKMNQVYKYEQYKQCAINHTTTVPASIPHVLFPMGGIR